MKPSAKVRWIQAVTFFLTVGLSSFCAFSIASTGHEMAMSSNSLVFTQAASSGQAHEASQCIDFHLAAMHNLSEAPGHGLSSYWAVLLLSALFVISVFGLFRNHQQDFIDLTARLRQFCEKTVTAFLIQLGSWLVLFAKRDPGRALNLGWGGLWFA